jgi:hypothetical protein
MVWKRAGAAAGLALTAMVAGAAVADTTLPEVSDVVPGHPGVTYGDLLERAIPKAPVKPLRHLAGKAFEGEPPDPLAANGFEAVRVKAGGRDRIVLLIDLGEDPDRAQGAALMALFDDGPTPRLLDEADVGVDKDTGFNDPTRLSLGPGDDALITLSEHSNSNQAYVGRLLVFVRGDKLQLIDDVSTFQDQGCGWRRDETPTFTTRPDPGRAYRRVDVVIREVLKRTDEDCGDDKVPRAYARAWRGAWRWDASRGAFKSTSADLDRLDTLNEARF